MRTLSIFLFVSVAACVLSPAQQFNNFVVNHHRQYASAEERSMRFEIFKDNLKEIKRLNDLHDGATYGITRFADMTFEEFLFKYTNMPQSHPHSFPNEKKYQRVGGDIPESYDCREKGLVTPVKDQGQCGSCWAFSAAQNAEGMWAYKGNDLVQLSPQQLVDCATASKYGCQGCDGGYPEKAGQYIVDVGGIELEEDYPYEGVQGACKFNKNRIAASFSGVMNIEANDEALAEYLVNYGPAMVGVHADFKWQLYTGGIISSKCYVFNHAVLAVGYGVEKNKKYWIIKNSWGDSWGEDGYIRVERGDDCVSKDAHSLTA